MSEQTATAVRTPRRRVHAEVRAGVVTAVVSVLIGLPAGALWSALAPKVQEYWFPYNDGGKQTVAFSTPYPFAKTWIAQDGYFAVTGAVIGLVLAVVALLVFRRQVLGATLGLVLGGVAGSVVMWKFGVWLGTESASHITSTVKANVVFDAPLRVTGLSSWLTPVHAKATLVIWPLVAAVVAMVVAAMAVGEDVDERRARAKAEWPQPGQEIPVGGRQGGHDGVETGASAEAGASASPWRWQGHRVAPARHDGRGSGHGAERGPRQGTDRDGGSADPGAGGPERGARRPDDSG